MVMGFILFLSFLILFVYHFFHLSQDCFTIPFFCSYFVVFFTNLYYYASIVSLIFFIVLFICLDVWITSFICMIFVVKFAFIFWMFLKDDLFIVWIDFFFSAVESASFAKGIGTIREMQTMFPSPQSASGAPCSCIRLYLCRMGSK